MAFRNYESLKLGISNYTNVGWRFALASIFYFILFLFFLTRNKNKTKNKNDYNEIPIIENNSENEIDKTEPFIEGRI